MRERASFIDRRRARTKMHAVFAATACAAILGVQVAAAEQLVFGCVLTDKQEIPPTGSTALGGGQFLIDTDANTVTYHIAFTGLMGAETAAHIHGAADPGVNAGVMTGLPAGNPKVGVWSYAEAQQADILAGKTYVNIHSTLFPGGEVRGQITRLNASLDGAQEVPAVPTSASGWGVFTINTIANQLTYHIAFGGLTAPETAAHIHGQALHGTNAGVAFALPLGSPKVGVWNYAEAQEEALLNGLCYVNVHSMAFPGGEIRGQVVPIVAPMDGQQEVPPNPSPGAGIALISLDRTGDALSYDLRVAGLAGAETAAHIHGFSPPGGNAGVLQPLPLGNRKLGVWSYAAADEPQILAGLTYANVHTNVFPGGEIRGQLRGFPLPPASDVAERFMAGAVSEARMAPNPLNGSGTLQFDLAQPAPVSVELFDSQGRLVRDLGEREFSAGPHAIAWDGRDQAGRRVASGIYHYVLATPEGKFSRHVSVLR